MVGFKGFGDYRFVIEKTAGAVELLKKYFHPDESVQIYASKDMFFVNDNIIEAFPT